MKIKTKKHEKHGKKDSRIYSIWASMLQRCKNPNDISYSLYGNKGISVCEDWEYFINFDEWAMSNGYQEDLSIDRIDSNGNYEPSNCRWVSMKVQQNNRSNNIKLTYNNETGNLQFWSNKTGIPIETLRSRCYYGWETERILNQPKHSKQKKEKDVTFKFVVKKYRSLLGLTQVEFAKILKVNKDTVKNWETGKSVAPKKMKEKILKEAKEHGISED